MEELRKVEAEFKGGSHFWAQRMDVQVLDLGFNPSRVPQSSSLPSVFVYQMNQRAKDSDKSMWSEDKHELTQEEGLIWRGCQVGWSNPDFLELVYLLLQKLIWNQMNGKN